MTKRKAMTAGELDKLLESNPEYQARMREVEERMARNAAEYRVLEAPLLAELREVGVDVQSTGNSEYFIPYVPLSPEVSEIFLRWIPNCHPRLQDSLVRLLAASEPRSFDGTVLIDVFERAADSEKATDLEMQFQVANTFAFGQPTGVTEWVANAVRRLPADQARGMLLIALAKLAPSDATKATILEQFDELPIYACEALWHCGGISELHLLEQKELGAKGSAKKDIKKAIKKIKRRLAKQNPNIK